MRFLRTAIEPTTLTPDEIEALVPRLAEACETSPVVLMYLHGAHASGQQGPLSDLDLAVLLETDAAADRNKILDLLASLQEISGREDVDLAVLNFAGPTFKERVVRQGRLVYARNRRDRMLFEAAAIKEGLDFRHYSRAYDEMMFKQLAEGRFLD